MRFQKAIGFRKKVLKKYELLSYLIVVSPLTEERP